MRNVYILLDYGDWVKDASNDRDDPYIQLLSTTDKTAAHNDFVQVRLNGIDTSNDPSHALLPADKGLKSPISSAEKKKMYEEEVLSRWPEIFVGCLAFVLIVVGVTTWRCCIRRRRRRAAQQAASMGLAHKGQQQQQTYQVLDENPSSVSLNMQDMSAKGYGDHPYSYSAYGKGSDV